ncbi:hypothetical protein A2U01_0038933, partial [Trifolium medium]|nr:hypothetical protein [Trifolium medium]
LLSVACRAGIARALRAPKEQEGGPLVLALRAGVLARRANQLLKDWRASA